MKINLKIVMTLGLLLLVMPLLFGYAAFVGADAPNLTNLHANSKDVSNTLCRSCHQNVTGAAAGTNGNLLNSHKRHFMSVFLNFGSNYVNVAGGPGQDVSSGCARCHQETIYSDQEAAVQRNLNTNGSAIQYVAWGPTGMGGLEGDLSYADGETTGSTGPNDTTGTAGDPPTGKEVNPQFCNTCHGTLKYDAGGVHTDTVNFTNDGGDVAIPNNPRGCEDGTCHDGGNGESAVVAHGANPWSGTSWIDQRYANSSSWCYRCHGELDFYQTNETN